MANLQDIRRDVVTTTGRQDLIRPLYDEAYYPDADLLNVDFFIHAAQKFLDDKVDFPGASAEVSVEVSADDYFITVPLCRIINDIIIEDSSGEAYTLQKKIENDLILVYGAPPFSVTSPGRPLHYSPASKRNHTAGNTAAAILKLSRQLYIAPTPDEAYTLRVLGKFYSAPLTADEEVNWWTQVYPHTLVQASVYMIERFYRNSEGARDALQGVEQDLYGIDSNVAEDDAAQHTSMNNSW